MLSKVSDSELVKSTPMISGYNVKWTCNPGIENQVCDDDPNQPTQ